MAEAASDRVQPVTARIALYDGDQQISNAEVIAFDSTAKDMNLWKKEVWLTLAGERAAATFAPVRGGIVARLKSVLSRPSVPALLASL